MVSDTVKKEIKFSKMRKSKIANFQKISDRLEKEFLNARRDSQFINLIKRMSAHRKKKVKFIRDSQRLLVQQKFTELAKLF